MKKYIVQICEDTGGPALYKRVRHGDQDSLVLIAHVGDFEDIIEALA